MITGVVLARNEEANIVECLRSLLPHVAEILLIDMESTDRTVELARPFVARTVSHPVVANFDAARNVAIAQARFDWLWFLDADERIPPKTGILVTQAIREKGHEITAITIPFKSYFCGKWIEHCGWWPGYTMARVLKRGHFRFSERLHGGVEFHGCELRLPPDPKTAIEHFSYHSIEHYLEKFNRYTSTEAGYLAQQGQPRAWQAAIRAMVRDLWLYYEQNDGHLDGEHGWILSWLAGQYRWFSHAKLLDVQTAEGDERRAGSRNGTVEGDNRRADGQELVPSSLDAVIQVMTDELAALRAPNPRLPLGIVWRAPIWDPSGYADDSRTLLKALARTNRELAADEIHWSDATCTLPDADVALLKTLTRCRRPPFVAAITSCIPSCVPTLCPPDRAASLNILRTTFETDRIPADWLPIIEQFDEVWVFSTHDQLSFRRSGVPPEKLRVLPGFVDTSLWATTAAESRARSTESQEMAGRSSPSPEAFRLPEGLQGRFVFLSVFDWQLRKGWDVLLRAYCAEFSPGDGTGLLLKISRVHGHALDSIRRQANVVLASLDQSLEHRPDIVIWDATLDTLEMAALYRSVDAFVLASRGEGWGRPYMEAMSCGLPTIGTRGSGNDDFMTESNSFLVSTTLVEVPDEAAAEIPVYREHRWLEPDVAELRSALRRVATDQSAREAVARRGAADIRAGFSLQQACEAVENNLLAAEGRFSCRTPAAVQASQVRVELEGELFAGHSFSNVNEAVSLRLMRHPSIGLSLRRVRLNPTFDSEAFHAHELRPYVGRVLPDGSQVTIRHAFPPNWTPPERGRWVHIQPWEYGALPLDWVRPLRDQVDEIWAPSNYVKRVYERSGIPSDKVHVIPWGVDTDVFSPDAPSLLMPTRRRFRFLFVGGTIGRKGFDLVLDAFLSEFTRRDDVCLVVKDMGTQSFYRYGNYRQQILEAMASGSAPEIVYLDCSLSPGQLASLYTACDCLVAPYRGEGFGLPILEAMACGLPAIVPRGGASDDFITDETGYRLAAEEVECHHDWRLCGVPTELSISVDVVRAAMRNACKHPQQNRRKGQLASAWVRQRFTWEKTAQTMAERLIALANSPPLPVADQTPESGRDLPAPTPALTVCMLCHNDEKTIGDSLGRVRPYVREVIVLDLGSTDRSTKIAAEYGARVYCGQLSDDFGSLRNAMLAHATSDWVLAVDADEVLRERELLKIMALTTSMPGDVSGVRVRVRDPEGHVDDDSNGAEVRLFRNHHEIVYSFRACEQVETSILRFGGRILASDIVLTRAGVRTQAPACYRCPQTRLELLHRDHAEHPDHPTVLFNLGQARFGEGDFFHAECYLNDCLQRSKPNDFHYRGAACLLIEAHLRKGDPYRATEVAQYVLEQAPDDPELRSTVARLAKSIGERV